MEQFILFRRRIGFGYGQPFKPQHKDIIDKDGKKGTIVCGGHGAVKRL